MKYDKNKLFPNAWLLIVLMGWAEYGSLAMSANTALKISETALFQRLSMFLKLFRYPTYRAYE